MAPEHISGSMWQLLTGEFVEDGDEFAEKRGRKEVIDGPHPVRVEEADYEGEVLFTVQGRGRTVYAKGSDFPSVVQEKK